MKYLNLDNNEIRELLYVRRESFLLYFFTLLLVSISSYFLFQLLVKSALIAWFVLFIAVSYTCFYLYMNRKYLHELIWKKKKVYRGALSFKSVSLKDGKARYRLCVDGHMFYVDKENFECIQEGDVVEFHVSPSTKHVFKMMKIE